MAQIYAPGKIPGVSYLQTVARTRGWRYVAAWGHRITGALLVLYVWFHIITMSSLTDPERFIQKMKTFSAMPGFFEWLLAIPVIFHALNGGRLILYELFGNRRDFDALKWVLSLSGFYLVLLGFFMAIGNQVVSALFFWSYFAAVSWVLVYLISCRLKKSGASLGWKFQRLSGAFLLLMIPGHMIFMHLDPAIGRDIQVITERMGSVFIKAVDFLLVCSVLYHGAYGVISICRDYLSPGRLLLACRVGVTAVTIVFAWIGIKLIFQV